MDFIRLTATIAIVLYHFPGHSNGNWIRSWFTNFANGGWGNAFVGVFFMMSGALLYYRYNDELDVPAFYRKRWRAIYPEFWLIFVCCFVKNAIRGGRLFYKGRPWTLLLSIAGMDGYLKYRIDNYYILGEWFLGAIVLIYLIYPLLLRFFRRTPLVLNGILLALCLIVERMDFFQILFHRNLIFCVFEFEIGMLLMKHREQLHAPVCVIACLLTEILLIAVRLPIRTGLYTAVSSVALYVILGELGSWAEDRSSVFKGLTHAGAEVSYTAYLLHRFVLRFILKIWNPGHPVGEIAVFIICILVLFACAKALHFIVQQMLRKLC